ncbi:MAG TPA: pilin [Patescibacteria group bacterium]|nr:pilin [Patescibacteria group bacterium]
MKKNVFLISVLILFLSFFQIVHAQPDERTEPCGDDEVCLSDPLGMEGSKDAPQVFIGRIIDTSLGVVGSLALLMFVYGGFIWMLAAGNSERVEKGKNILFWATIGLVVIFTSYVIVHFVIFELIGAPGGGG